jgi:hypothetical protein
MYRFDMTKVSLDVAPCNSYQLIKTHLSFNTEDEGRMLLRNVGNDLPDYMVLYSPHHKNLRPGDAWRRRFPFPPSLVPHINTTLPTLGLHFYSEKGGNTYLRNVGKYLIPEDGQLVS